MDVSDCITRYGLLLNQRVGKMKPTQKMHATLLSRVAQVSQAANGFSSMDSAVLLSKKAEYLTPSQAPAFFLGKKHPVIPVRNFHADFMTPT